MTDKHQEAGATSVAGSAARPGALIVALFCAADKAHVEAGFDYFVDVKQVAQCQRCPPRMDHGPSTLH